jgi:hypothetical protein
VLDVFRHQQVNFTDEKNQGSERLGNYAKLGISETRISDKPVLCPFYTYDHVYFLFTVYTYISLITTLEL